MKLDTKQKLISDDVFFATSALVIKIICLTRGQLCREKLKSIERWQVLYLIAEERWQVLYLIGVERGQEMSQ